MYDMSLCHFAVFNAFSQVYQFPLTVKRSGANVPMPNAISEPHSGQLRSHIQNYTGIRTILTGSSEKHVKSRKFCIAHGNCISFELAPQES